MKEELYLIEEMLNKWENIHRKHLAETLSEYREWMGEFMADNFPGGEILKTHSDLILR